MLRRSTRWRIAAAVAPLLLMGAALSGCATNDTASAGSATSEKGSVTSEKLPTDVPAGTTLNFADQGENIQTLMNASGFQGKLKAKVKYANFQGGPDILEAIRSGSIDLAYVGDTPPIQAQAAGQTVLIVGALRTSAPDYQLAVAPGEKISTLDQLKGKKIAYAEGSGRQPFVLRALKKAGLSKDDVTLVPLSVDEFPDAVRSGEVDVAPINEPTITHYLEAPGASKVPADQLEGLSNGLHYLYASADALKDPAKAAAISDFVQQWVKAEKWAIDNPAAWVKAYYVDTSDVSAADGERVVKAQGSITFPHLNAETIAKQQDTVNVIYEFGDIPKKLDAADEFDTRFDSVIDQAAKEVNASRESW